MLTTWLSPVVGIVLGGFVAWLGRRAVGAIDSAQKDNARAVRGLSRRVDAQKRAADERHHALDKEVALLRARLLLMAEAPPRRGASHLADD